VTEEKNKWYKHIPKPAETKITKLLYYGTNKLQQTELYNATKLTPLFETEKEHKDDCLQKTVIFILAAMRT
jgi:hypothetical protein